MHDQPPQWYLGLDWSGTGLQASLAQYPQGSVHPLIWLHGNQRHDTYPVHLRANPDASLSVMNLDCAASVHTPSQTTMLNWADLYPHLRRAVPFFRRRQHQWYPALELPGGSVGGQSLLLQDLQQTLQAVLQRIIPTPDQFVCGENLSDATFRNALQQLAGVVIACPATWGATYRFNLREAILSTRLVETPDQVLCVDSPLAIALAYQAQSQASAEIVVRSQDCTTLALSINTAVTEVASWTESLADAQFHPHKSRVDGYNYGVSGLQEDVFYQLLYPQWLPHQDFLTTFDWQFPQVGAPDFPQRDRATLSLTNHAMGSTVLTLARQVLQILYHRPTVAAQLGTHPWHVHQRQLAQMLLPGVTATLNHSINKLLSRQGQTSRQVRQLLWQPQVWQGLAPLLTSWLQTKFPQARLVAVTARLADGLALLPSFPGSLERHQHQYDDYFLLRELLQAINAETVNLSGVCQNLRRQGLHTKDCRDRIAQFLAGYQPSGWIPDAADPWVAPESQTTVEYQALRSQPLFVSNPHHPGQFHCDSRQRRRAIQYLEQICAHSHQELNEPLLLPWSL